MKKDSFTIEVRAFSALCEQDRKQVSRFIQDHSDMDEDYAESEFFRYLDRDLLIVRSHNRQVKCILSAKYFFDKEAFVYWGDLIKDKSFKGLNLGYLFFRYLLNKEGFIGIFLRKKSFLSFCYNPRVLDFLPRYLDSFSSYSQNSSHPLFTRCIEQLGYHSSVFAGFFQDTAIQSKRRLHGEKRYRSKNQSINDFFSKHVLQSDEQQHLFYTGWSLAIVTRYSRTKLFHMSIDFIRKISEKSLFLIAGKGQ
jgi:hypothetical protein